MALSARSSRLAQSVLRRHAQRSFTSTSPSHLQPSPSSPSSAPPGHGSTPSPTPSSSPASPHPSTVSQDEVSHFNALAADWWSPHGSSRLLHLMNPLRHDFIAACRSSTSRPAPAPLSQRYLDIGCGGGIFAETAARLPSTATVLAIDPSPQVLAVAREHARRDPLLHNTGRLNYVNTSIEKLPLPRSSDEQVDVLTLFEVLEHIDSPSAFLERCLPHVKLGGWIVGSTIARTWTSWLLTKVVAEDVMRIVPPGTHDWSKYLNEEELKRWFQGRSGWEGWTSNGCVYLPGIGWKMIPGGERVGNYFFGVRKSLAAGGTEGTESIGSTDGTHS